MEFETTRLTVRRITMDDAGFMLALLNDPGFLGNIGDRGVRTIEDARRYVAARVLAAYETHGYGSLHVARRDTGEAIGTVGFHRREGLDGPDLGFAFLAGHVGCGYGFEAATGLLASQPALRPLLAITAPHNLASARLLGKLGFAPAGEVTLPGHDGASRLFRLDHPATDGTARGGAADPAAISF